MPGTVCGKVPDVIDLADVMKTSPSLACNGNGPPDSDEAAIDAVSVPMEEDNLKCAECGARGTKPKLCGGCWKVWYCSKMHQVKAWGKHTRDCYPWQLAKSPEIGRYMVATRNIAPGEIITSDPPIIIGPKQITEPVCLACYSPVDGEYSCKDCGFPLCGPECDDAESHQPECIATSNSGAKAQVTRFRQVNSMYECITPLRVLNLKETSQAKWKQIMELESHLDKRENSEIVAIQQKTVVEVLKNRIGLTNYSDETIQHVLGAIDVNAFEIRLSDVNIQGLYPNASMLEHSCIPNTHRTFDADLNLVVRAAVNIKLGQHITSCYTDALYTTAARHEHLLTSKYFACVCPRCSDPSECGTFLSSLKCPQCNDGFVLADDPTSSSTDWKCGDCANTVDADYATNIVSVAQDEAEELEAGNPTIENCETFLRKWEPILHCNHAVLIQIKYPLLHLYGSDGMESLLPNQVLRKEMICKDILKVADVIAPGISRLRGTVLYEFYQALYWKTIHLFKAKIANNAQAKKLAKDAYFILEECARVLSYEPEVQPEGQLGLEAKEELRTLKDWIIKEGWNQ